MIRDEHELEVTLERIRWFQDQLAHLRKTETNPQNYHAACSGFLAEIDRMQREAREFYRVPPGASTTTNENR